jgi:nucleoside-diphosphate-sugar epimerase
MGDYILVTGAAGFIGRHLVKELIQSSNVIIITHNRALEDSCFEKVIQIKGTLSNIESIIIQLNKYKIAGCIHLAWEGIPDFGLQNCQKNFDDSVNVLRLCKELGIKRLIITGSCMEYKKINGFVKESAELERRNLFSACKNAIHDFSHIYCKENAIKLHWLRLFYVYGKGQRTGSIIPYLIKEYGNNREPVLKTPYTANDYVSVEDTARAIMTIWTENPQEEIFNICTGVLITAYQISLIVKRAYGLDRNRDSEDNTIMNAFGGDNGRILLSTSWKPIDKMQDIIYGLIKENERKS